MDNAWIKAALKRTARKHDLQISASINIQLQQLSIESTINHLYQRPDWAFNPNSNTFLQVFHCQLSKKMASNKSWDLASIYREYIRAIMDHDLEAMSKYVCEDVVHNSKKLNLEGYKDLLRRNIVTTNMRVSIERLVTDESHVAALLIFTVMPETQELVGVELDDEQFSFPEHVFYDFKDGRIARVHSLFDIDAIRSRRRQEWHRTQIEMDTEVGSYEVLSSSTPPTAMNG